MDLNESPIQYLRVMGMLRRSMGPGLSMPSITPRYICNLHFQFIVDRVVSQGIQHSRTLEFTFIILQIRSIPPIDASWRNLTERGS